MRKFMAIAGAACVVLTACSNDTKTVAATVVTTTTTTAAPTTTTTAAPTTTTATTTAPPPKDAGYIETVKLATKDIEEFWVTAMPEVYGKPFEGLAAGYHPYSPDVPPPACGNSPSSYKEMAGNAFYCPAGDFIAFDDYQLFPELNKEFGNFTLALVLAHEWGHGIQERAAITGPTVYLEQQAD